MPTIEVDLIFFIVTLVIGIFSAPFVIIWTMWKSYKNPEFWLRVRRQDWIYILMKTPMNKVRQIVIPVRRIQQNGEVRLFGKRRYFIRDHSPEGNISTFIWKHNKPGYHFVWNDPFPQAYVPGNSLTSMTDPETINEIEDNNIMMQLMKADFVDIWMKASLAIGIVAILISMGVIFVLIGVGNTATHADCLLRAGNNGTLAAACH